MVLPNSKPVQKKEPGLVTTDKSRRKVRQRLVKQPGKVTTDYRNKDVEGV